MGRHALIAALVAGVAAASGTGEVQGTVRLSGSAPEAGQPEVVVYLTGFRQPPPAEAPVIAQRNKTFVPHLQVIVAGQSVRFTNDDQVVHNVFSNSRARPFDLGKPGPGQARLVKFPEPGLVEVFCNIHESMWAHVLVLPNRAFALADDQGRFTLRGVPPGRYPIYAWGRGLQPVQSEVTVTAGKVTHVALEALPRFFNPAHLDKFGRPYRIHPGYEP